MKHGLDIKVSPDVLLNLGTIECGDTFSGRHGLITVTAIDRHAGHVTACFEPAA